MAPLILRPVFAKARLRRGCQNLGGAARRGMGSARPHGGNQIRSLEVLRRFRTKFCFRIIRIMFLVEGALYYERGTKLSEPNALNTPLLVTVGPNSGDDIVIMMSGA